MANERTVSWTAVANFAQVTREAARSERALKSLKKTQEEFNAGQKPGMTAAQSKAQATSLDRVTKANKDFAASKRALNKANSDTVKTSKENVGGQATGYLALAAGMKEAAKQRRALNRANSEAVLTPKENVSGRARSYEELAASMKALGTAQRAVTKANKAYQDVEKTNTSAPAREALNVEDLAKAKLKLAEASRAAASAARDEKKAGSGSVSRASTIRVPSAPSAPSARGGESDADLVSRVRATLAAKKANDQLTPSYLRVRNAEDQAATAAARLQALRSKSSASAPQLLSAQIAYERSVRNLAYARQLDAVATRKQADATAAASAINLPYTRGLEASRKAAAGLSPSLAGVSRESRNVERDATRAGRGMDGFGRSTRSLRADAAGAGNGIRGIGGALKILEPEFRRNELSAYRFGTVLRAAIVPLVITGINLLASLLSPLAAGFIGLAGAIAPVVGLLGALPGLLAAAAGGVGVLIAGFAGIGGALKAYNAMQKATTGNAIKSGKAAKTNANQQASSARQIKQAEQSLSDAHEREKEAQQGVTDARKKARIEMEQMQKALRDLALQEEGESLSLEEARQRLTQVMDDPGSTDLQRRQANLAVRDAQNSLDGVRDQQKTATADAAEAAKKGVEGSDTVVQAKKAEAQASRSVKDAEDALADARRSGAASQDAYNDSLAAGSTQANAYADAMAKLTPEAQAVVKQLIKMKPLIDGIRATAQRGLLPGVLSLLKDVTVLAPLVDRFVGRAAKSFGEFFANLGQALTTDSALKTWGKILDSTLKVINYFLDAAFNLGVVLVNIAVAARPLTEWLARSVRDWTRSWRAMTSGEAGQKRLTEFFKKTQIVAAQLGRIIGNVVGIVFNLGKGAQGTGKWILNSFERMTKGWKKFTGSVKGQNAISAWAKGAQPALHEIAGLIGDTVKGILDLGKKTDIASIIKQIRDQLLPAVLSVFGLFTGETAGHIISLLSNIGDIISKIAGANGGGLNTFFETLDTISGSLDKLISNSTIAREVLAGLIAIMAGKAAISFASSILGVSGAIKTAIGVTKTAKKVLGGGEEAAALAQGAKRAAPSKRAAKAAAKAKKKDVQNQAKAASESGAKRGVGTIAEDAAGGAPVRSTPKQVARDAKRVQKGSPAGKSGARRAMSGAAPEGSRLATMGAKATPRRAAGAVEGAEGGVKALGGIAKVLPKLKFLGAVAGFLPLIAEGLAAIGPVGWIVIAVIAAVTAIVIGIMALAKRFPEQFAGIKAFFAGLGQGILAVFNFIIRLVKFNMALMGQIFSVAFQIIRNIVYIAMDLIRVFIIRPIQIAVKIIGALLSAFGAIMAKRLREVLAVVQIVWALIRAYLIDPVISVFKAIGSFIANTSKTIWGLIKALVRGIIDYFNLQPTIDKVKGFLGVIHDKFVDMVDKIKGTVDKIKGVVGKAFDAIKKVVADPIGIVIGFINNGIIKPYQALAKTFGIDTKASTIDYKLPTFQKGGELPGYANGGKIPGVQSATKRDNLLGVTSKGKAIARVEPGEFIMPRNKQKYFPLLERIRRGGDLPGYKNGGELFNTRGSFKNRKFDSDMLLPPTEKQLRDVSSYIPGIGNVAEALEEKARNRGRGPKQLSGGYGGAGDDAAKRGLGMTGDYGWLNRCLAFVNQAWNFQVGRFRLATARDSMNAGPRTMNGRPPAGAGVYWDTGPSGHIALGIGDGTVVSNDIVRSGRLDRVPQNAINKWGPYKGWWSPTGAKGTKGGLGGEVSDFLSKLPNPITFLKAGYNKVAGKLKDISDSEFGQVVKGFPKTLFDGLIANAKSIFNEKNANEDKANDTDPTTMTSADRGKGGAGDAGMKAVKNALSLVGSYASGTNSTSRGRILVGENGPEIIESRGGDRVINNNLTRRLPGYNKGGVVNGMKQGASGDWVRALRSETHQGTSSKWTSALSDFLRSHITSVGTPTFNNYNKSSDLVNTIVKFLKKQKKNQSIDAISKALKIDQTTIWQNRTAIASALKSAKASKGDQSYFGKTSSSFGSARTKWLKALEKKTGESQDGSWGDDSDEPAQHMLYHAFGMPHDDYLAHPWKANTPAEAAIMEQRRSNKINAEFDKLVQTFNGWNLTSLVRKMGELGPSDGLTLARDLSKNRNAATAYDKDLQDAYARSDAANDTASTASKVNLLVSVLTPTGTPIGLQGAAQALSLSLDSATGIYDLANSQGRLKGLNTGRIDKDVIDFRKLFKFATGGAVPGIGNSDSVHAMLTPGEFVLRRSASREIERRFGPGTLDYFNNIDRFNTGGFAGGISTPSFRGSRVSIANGGRSDTTNSSNKTVNYNFNTQISNPTVEEGAVSVQKRVTKVAQLGLLRGSD